MILTFMHGLDLHPVDLVQRYLHVVTWLLQFDAECLQLSTSPLAIPLDTSRASKSPTPSTSSIGVVGDLRGRLAWFAVRCGASVDAVGRFGSFSP